MKGERVFRLCSTRFDNVDQMVERLRRLAVARPHLLLTTALQDTTSWDVHNLCLFCPRKNQDKFHHAACIQSEL